MAGKYNKDYKLEKRLQFVQKINKNKEILFGAFSEKITRSVKIEKWKELAELAKKLDLMRSDKDYIYARDTLWQNIKKTTLAKAENAKRASDKITESDHVVLNIIGEECSLSDDQEMIEELNFVKTQYLNESSINQSLLFASENDIPSASRISVGPNKRKRTSIEESSSKAEKKEQHLLIEHLKLQNYKAKLEILKLETELNLPRSQYTKNFAFNEVTDEEDK